jgi:choline dehydrogenase-like flavoprotein
MAEQDQFEYVVVGSGAGGGTVAARLALAGHKVLLLEAGGDYINLQGGNPIGANRLPQDYQVPTFHALSTENEALSWGFWVRHYTDNTQQERDDKYYKVYKDKPVDGVWYPRAGALGGCTAHNAMIMVYPHNPDWDYIAEITNDPSWGADNMRSYFERMEDCRHRPVWRWIYKVFGWNRPRHGYDGWLTIEKALPLTVLGDVDLITIVKRGALKIFQELRNPIQQLIEGLVSQLDPNDWRLDRLAAEGLHYAPLSTHNHARNGTREFLLQVAQDHPDKLKIELDALATKVVFDPNDRTRAIGVTYLKGEGLYRASARLGAGPGTEKTVHVSREVILSGGAFNTPQLLKLSGIGAKAELERHNIEVRLDLPGVGTNLQDRYEVGIVSKLKNEWEVLKGANFSVDDRQGREWVNSRTGVYTTNGAALAVIKRSVPERPLPDLFIFALLGRFKGYFPEYSKLLATPPFQYLTWAVLKAHTNNPSGTVTLRSTDPRDTPVINFNYFEKGQPEDAESVAAGVEFVRTLNAQVANLIEAEEHPGPTVKTHADVVQFVKDRSWGHHASCSCPIGRDGDPMAVLDGNFRVRGIKNLRVVDASVFPRIPGFFIVTSVYMIGEKAADVIAADARKSSP